MSSNASSTVTDHGDLGYPAARDIVRSRLVTQYYNVSLHTRVI